jgi:hypothetical protein
MYGILTIVAQFFFEKKLALRFNLSNKMTKPLWD